MLRTSPILDHRGQPLIKNQSSYESASHGRRAKNWHAPGSGPNRTLNYNLSTLRNRSRAGVRNNPWLWSALDTLVANEVGIGVTLRSISDNITYRDSANRLWRISSEELDPEGVLNFGGLQTQCVRARREAGELFIRRRRRRIDNTLAVPIQVQILEAEFVPESLDRDLSNGRKIRSGIEFNRRGQRTAYWMYREHPQDNTGFDFNRLVRVPARDIIHHYMPTRPGQRRGEPNAARSLLSAHTFDQYEDAELVRKQTRAPFTGFLSREQYNDDDYKYDPFTGEPINGGEDSPLVNVEAGTFLSGLPGEELKLFDGDKTGDGFKDYSQSVLRKIAAGHGVPYEMMSGDWSAVNDRLVRAIRDEFHRSIESAQDHLLIFQVCTGIWRWWVDAAVFSGRLVAPGYANNQAGYRAMQARPHAWRYSHPEQDVNAKIKAMESGLTSRQAIIDEMPGPSMEEVDAQIASDNHQNMVADK